MIEKHETDYHYDIQVPAAAFMKVCNHAPVTLTSFFVSEEIEEHHLDFDKPKYRRGYP